MAAASSSRSFLPLYSGELGSTTVQFYMLPVDTVLFRGRKSHHTVHLRGPGWFTTEQEAASIYGYVDEYRVTTTALLLNMADFETHQVVSELFDTWSHHAGVNDKALQHAFPIEPMTRTVLRDSEFAADDIVVKFFQAMHEQEILTEFAGWATDEMSTLTTHSFHHPEIILLQPAHYLEFVRVLETNETVTEQRKTDIALKAMAARDAEARQKAKRKRHDETPFKKQPKGRKLF